MKLIDEIPYWFCCGSTDSMKHADSCKESKLYNPDCKWGTLKHHLNFNAYCEEEATFTTEKWDNLKPYPTPTQYANALARVAELEAVQTKPLSDEEIYELYASPVTSDKEMVEFARAIEERHGIK